MADYIVYISRNQMEVVNLDTGATANGAGEFTSERILIGNYPPAEKLLAGLVKSLASKSLFAKRTRLIVQPLEMIEGGLSMIEDSTFKQLGVRAGAIETRVYVGERLSREAAATLLK
jgi:hypothetical protein